MTIYLRQSTASQEVPLGYFLDSTDGNTEKTALTIANTDIKVWKTGASTVASKNSGGATHISNGIYYTTLDATDTDTLGPIVLFTHVAGALVVRVEGVVLAANVYDSMILGTDLLDTSVVQWTGTNVATPDTAGYPKVTLKSGTGAGEINLSSGNLAGSVASVVGAVGSVTGSVGSVVGAVGSVTGAVGSVTGNVGGNVVGSVASVTGNVGGNVVGSVASVTGNVGGSVASVTGNVGGNVVGSVASVTAAVTLSAKDSHVARNSTAQAGAAGSITLDASASATTDYYVGEQIKIDSGTGLGQTRIITAYNGTTKVATVDRNWATNPDATSVFTVITSDSAKTDSSLQITVGAYASGQAPLQPTVAGRTLDVTTTGEAGIDWANVGSPTTTLNLSGTTISTGQTITSVSGAVGSVTGAVGSVTGAVGSVTGNVGGNVVGTVASVVGAVGSVTGSVGSVTGNVGGSVASVTGNVGGNVTGSVGSVATGGITAASFAAGAIDAAAIATDAITSAELATSAVSEIADAVWDITLASHLTAGSTGAALNAAGGAGDPWTTALPGAYGAGSAGFILGTNLDALVSSRLAPTVAGRTLDVTATGEAGIDWANIGSPTTTVNLSGTTISTSQVVASVTGAVGSVTGAVASVTGSVGSVTGNVGGNVVGSVASVTGNVGGSVASVTGNVGGNVVGSVASVTGNVGGNVTGSVGSIATGGITSTSFAASAIDSNAIAATGASEIAGAVWNEPYGSHVSVNSYGQLFYPIRSGTAQAGAAGSITLDVGASASDNFFNTQMVRIYSGTGTGQTRLITSYVGATKVASVTPNWVTNPDNTSTYLILNNVQSNVGQWLSSAPNALISGRVDSSVGEYQSGLTPLQPTVSGRTLDVTATGEAGIDWANIGAPTTTVNLSGTTISTSQVVASVTGGVGSVGLVGVGAISASSLASGTITAAKFAADAIDSSALAASAASEIAAAVWDLTRTGHTTAGTFGEGVSSVQGNVTGSVGSVTGAVGSVTGSVGSVTGAVGSVTGNVGGNVVGTVASVVGAVGSVTGNVGGNVTGSVGSVATGGITASSFAAGAIDAAAIATDAITSAELATSAVSEIAGAVWDITLASHLTGGTTGAALNAAGSAGDPWSTALPGAYSAGSAGFILGTNLDDTVSSRLAPTVSGRTLDVTTTGEAGIDWANIGSPTTTVNLSGTTISTGQTITSVSGSVGSVTGSVGSVTGAVGSVTGNVGGNVTGSVGSVVGNVGGNVVGSVASVTGSVGSVTGAVGSVTGNVDGNVVGSVASVTAAVTLSAKDSSVVRNATAQAGAASTITLDASASATNSFYNGTIIKIDSGTGAGQTRTITSYVGATKVATIDRSWITNPDATSVFTVVAKDNPKVNSGLETTAILTTKESFLVRNNTAQAGASTSITLDAGASATNDMYTGQMVKIDSGTGIGQNRIVTAYNGTTKVATVNRAWITNPDATSIFTIFNGDLPSVNAALEVVSASVTGNVGGNVTGSVGSVTGAVGSVTGAVGSVTGNVGGNVVGSVASVTGNVGGNVTGSVGSVVGTVGSVTGSVGSVTGNVGGNVVGTVASVVGAVGSVTGNVGGNVTGSVGSVATGGITSASFAAGAIDAAAIATDAITSVELATSAVSEIADAVWDVTLASHLTSGTTGAALNAAGSAGDPWNTALPGAYGAGSAGFILGTNLDATVSSRLASASYTAPDNSTIGTINTKLGTPVTSVSADIAGVQSDTNDIQTRLPATLVSGRMDSSVGEYQSGLTPLQPTTAGRTLDVTATGEAGIDWANIGSPTTTVNLSGTTISTGQTITSVSGSVGSVTGSVGSVTGSVGSVTGAVGSVTGNVGGNVVGSVGSVTAAVTLNSYDTRAIRSNTAQAGASSSITLDAGASSTTDFYVGTLVELEGGIGAGQARTITAYNGTTKVATIDRAWATNPDATTVFTVVAADNAKVNTSLEVVSASVTGAVASVTGSVGSVTGSVGSVTGAVGSVTGNVGGNVVGSVASVTGNVGGNVVGTVASVVGAVGSVTGNVGGNVTGSVGSIATGGIVAASFATDSITSTALAASAVTEIQTGLATSSALATVQADTDDIQTRLPAALVGGRIDASVGAYQSGLTPLQPTTAGRTLDVTATGEAGIDWANIGSPTTTVNLSGTTISTSQSITSVSGSVGSVTGSVGSVTGSVGSVTGAVGSVTGNVGGNVTGSVGSIATGGITSTSFAAGAIDAAAIATDAITSAELATSAITEIAGAVWDEARASHTTAGTFGQGVASVQGNVTGSVASVTGNVGGNVVGNVASVTGSVGSVTGAVGSVTGNVGGNVVGTVASVVGAVGSVTGNVGGNVTGSVGSVATGGITAASFDAGAIDAAAIATDAITSTTLAASAATEIASAVWDEAASSHVSAGSFGQTVQSSLRTGTAQAGSVNTITLDAGASASNSFYNDQIIRISSGTGANQSRVISAYNGTTKVATVSSNWVTNPDATSAFVIQAFGVSTASTPSAIATAVWEEATSSHLTAGTFGQANQPVRAGTAQAGASTTVTLDAGASASDSYYNDTLILITSGTGAGQSRGITNYVGSTKVATVTSAWTTNPDNTSVFVIYPFAFGAASSPSTIASAVWDLSRTGHANSGTFGEGVASVQGNVTGSVASVTGAVGSVTGSVGSVTGSVGSVTGSVGSVTGNVGGDVTGSVGSIATGGITASSFAAGAIDAAAIATDAITSAELATSAVTEIASAVWEEARASHTTAGTFGQGVASVQGNVTGSVDSVTGSVGSVTGAVGSVTGNIGGNVVGSVASVTGNVGGNVVGTVASVVGAVGSVTGAVGSVTGNVGGNVTGSVGSIATGGITSTSFAASAINAAAIASSAITAAKFATDAIDANALAASAVTEIQTGLATASALATIQSDTDDIQTRLPVALVSGKMDVSVGAYQSGLTPLQPTVSGRTLDVTLTGEAGIDWSNIGAPTTVVNLSGTTISTSQAVASVSGSVGSVTGSVGSVTGNVGGNVVGTVASVVGAVGSVTGNVGGDVTGSVGSVATGGITSSSFAANSITNTALATSAATEIAGAVWDETLASHAISGSTGEALSAAGASGDPWITALPGSYTSGQAGFILGTNLDALVSSRLASGSYTAPDNATIGTINTKLGTPVTSVSADIAGVQSDTNDIQTRLPAVLVSGRMASDAVAISGSTIAADAVESNIGNLDATVSSRLASASYTTAPNVGSIADAVWDEILSGHAVAGSTGEALTNAGSPSLNPTDISDAVWNAARSSYVVAGSFGQGVASVQGNVTGSVASVVGAVGSVTGSVGSVTGAVGSVTGAVGSVTGNVGGNLVGSIGSLGATASTNVSSSVTSSLTAMRLDELMSSALASQPSAGSLFGDLTEDNGSGTQRFTTVALENAPSGGSGTSDWTVTEKAQIRFRLGLDGSTNTPSATPDLADSNDVVDILDSITTAQTSIGTVNTKIGTPSVSVSADIASVQSDTDDIQSRLPAALVGGRMASDAVAISGSSIAADNVETNIVNLDATVSSRLASASYTTAPNVAAIADAVWDEALSDHLGVGTTGNRLNAAASAGDPWATNLPGGYAAGEAGYILGNLSGGGGSNDWTATELQQIRYRLGIDGVSSVPSASPHLTTGSSGGGASTGGTSTELNLYAAAAFEGIITGADISGVYTKLTFTAKLLTTQSLYAKDSLIQITDDDGLKYLNSAAVDLGSAGLGSLTIDGSNIVIAIDELITVMLPEAYGVKWDIKKTTTNGVNIIASGVMNIRRTLVG